MPLGGRGNLGRQISRGSSNNLGLTCLSYGPNCNGLGLDLGLNHGGSYESVATPNLNDPCSHVTGRCSG